MCPLDVRTGGKHLTVCVCSCVWICLSLSIIKGFVGIQAVFNQFVHVVFCCKSVHHNQIYKLPVAMFAAPLLSADGVALLA